MGTDTLSPLKKPIAVALPGLFLLAILIVGLRDLGNDHLPNWLLLAGLGLQGLLLAAALLRSKESGLWHRAIEITSFQGTVGWFAVRDTLLIQAAAAAGATEAAVAGQSALIHFVLLMGTYALIVNPWWRVALMLLPAALVPVILSALFVSGEGAIGAAWIGLLAMGLATLGVTLANFLFHGLSKKYEDTQYEMLEKLGTGGMGEVWLVRHKTLARPAALKMIKRDVLTDRSEGEIDLLLRRFEREARAMAALRSPNSVEIYDFGISGDGTFYFVMEYLNGFDLDRLVQRHGPLSPARTIYLLRQACRSLAEAHSQEMIHRDLKPANLHVSPMGLSYDFLKVLDFGLVSGTPNLEEGVKLTIDNQFSGTPAYIAPEMVIGDGRVDGRSDIYELGCVAYWLLTGQMVFDEKEAMRMIVAHASKEPDPPSTRVELEIPTDLEQVVMKCLAKAPDDRYASASELEAALAQCDACSDWSNRQAEEWWLDHGPAPKSIPGTESQLGLTKIAVGD